MRVLENLSLANFDLTTENLRLLDQQTLVVTKKDWDYPLALAFQEEMCERVRSHTSERVFIFCSHPHCLTLGTGLQRNKAITVELVDFDPLIEADLELPLYRIKRGGGLTFHYPGQLIFYPIVSLDAHKTRIFDLLMSVLESTATSLTELYQLNSLEYKRDLLGLWHYHYKLASIGVSARRFISMHGLALNLFRDPLMAKTLSLVHPCGLRGTTYTYLEDLVGDLPVSAFDKIQEAMLRHLPLERPTYKAIECVDMLP